MKKMKIGLVSPYNMFRGGGVQECVLALQSELVRRGHDAKIITPQPRNYDGEAPDNMIFLGGSTDFKSPFHTTAQVSVTANPDRIDEVLAEEKFDLLHFHEPWVPIVSRQILTRSNAVNVATFHAKLPDNVMSRTIEMVIAPYTRSILKYIDEFTAVSEPATDWVCQLIDEPISLIPNGVDLHKYKLGRHPKSDQPTIFYVGRLEKRKGVMFLLQAFEVLQQRRPDVRLVIGGEGPDREKLEDFVADTGLQNVTFLGYMSEADKIKYLQASDVFCSPALYGESFGIVLIEAIACGIPTIGGANPGYESVLTGRGALGLVNPKDTEDFARRLELFIDDEAIRSSWKKWAKEYVTQYGYTQIVDQYEKIYQQALRKHR